LSLALHTRKQNNQKGEGTVNKKEKRDYESRWNILLHAAGYEPGRAQEDARLDAVSILALLIVMGFIVCGWVWKG
jgi:hypothetical protein